MASYSFKKNVLPLLVKAGIGLGIGILVALIRVVDPGFIQNVDHLTTDYRYQARYDRQKASNEQWDPKLSNVIIVGIRDKDLTALPETFPFPRSVPTLT